MVVARRLTENPSLKKTTGFGTGFEDNGMFRCYSDSQGTTQR